MSNKKQVYSGLSNIDFKLLGVFQAVVKNEGFSAAQYDLNMGLPAISTAMTQLETRVGFKLCERGRGGFHLTEGGVAVHEALQLLFISAEAFQNAVNGFKGDMHGQIKVAVDDAIVTNPRCPLYKILREFSKATPNLHLNLIVLTAPKIEAALVERQLSIGIGPFRDVSESLEKDLLYNENHQLCCGLGHSAFGLTDKKQIDVTIAKSNYATSSNDNFYKLDHVEFAKCTNTSNMDALLALILSGQYVGYLPRHVSERWVEKGEVFLLLPKVYSYITSLYITYRSDHNDPRVSLFLKAVNEFSC